MGTRLRENIIYSGAHVARAGMVEESDGSLEEMAEGCETFLGLPVRDSGGRVRESGRHPKGVAGDFHIGCRKYVHGLLLRTTGVRVCVGQFARLYWKILLKT